MSRCRLDAIARRAARTLFVAMLAGAAFASPSIAEAKTVPFWRDARVPAVRQASSNARASRLVIMDAARLQGAGNASLSFLLPDGTSLVATRLRVEQPKRDATVWFGRVRGDSLGSVILSVVRGKAFGSIHTSRGAIYRIVSVGGDTLRVDDVDPAGVPDERDPRPSLSVDSTGAGGVGCATDDPTRIDVMVVYTADARIGAGGADAMEATMYTALGQANQSYMDSGIIQRLRLVYVGEVPYTETDDVGGPLIAFDDPADPVMQGVRDLRNTHGADVIAFIIERDDNECGYANIMEAVSPSFEDLAFAVVVRDCATSGFTFAHELGHVMSARHEWMDDANNNLPFVDNHGYVKIDASASPKTAWRTIMAVRSECEAAGVADDDCTRLQLWSNPDNWWGGVRMGVDTGAWQSDNVSTLNATAATVANFRCSSPGRADTWMKDAWADTGAEPEPALAGEPMWKSPYIWVRNKADAELLQPHDHENPIAAVVNYVYVKLHNGEGGASGDLEVYVAKASTGLAWPADWKRIGSTAVTSLGAGETRIVESTWTPTEGGHFCLLARWVSTADPMAVPEGTNIDANVRANNNLVWRNVNIIDLSGSTEATASLRMGNPGPSDKTYSLTIRPAERERLLRRAWAGSLVVQLDPKVAATWRLGGRRGRGFREEPEGLRIVAPDGAVIAGLRLPAGARPEIRLRFLRDPRTKSWRAPFELDVIQSEARRGFQPRVVGGVSYEIQPWPRGK